jgi:predicted hydrocarbon binding protein
VAEGNSVLACFDEGSGKDEDLVGMMSLSGGVIKTELREGKKVLTVVKHPEVKPTRIEISVAKMEWRELLGSSSWDHEMYRRIFEAEESDRGLGREFKELGVNSFWPGFAFWSSMLWDPKRFPEMRYELTKKYGSFLREVFPMLPWRKRFFIKMFMPKNLSKERDFKKVAAEFEETVRSRGFGIMKYLEAISKTDEHHFRIDESHDCWGFESVGAPMALLLPPFVAGWCKGIEREIRDWNGVETKCVGLGDPHCEFKMVPGEIDELRSSLQKEGSDVEKIHDRLMNRLMSFLLEGKPLVERPRLGSDVYMEAISHAMGLPAMTNERYRMALRMGGVKVGKKIDEQFREAEVGEKEAEKLVLHFLEHCKVGKIRVDETIRIMENRESTWTKGFKPGGKEPSCFFTTGFLNGFFYSTKNQHLREVKCIATGDPYCEWEFR